MKQLKTSNVHNVIDILPYYTRIFYHYKPGNHNTTWVSRNRKMKTFAVFDRTGRHIA